MAQNSPGRGRELAQNSSERVGAWRTSSHTATYARLATRRLPTPHHLYHIPYVLAEAVAAGRRVALLVFDGMSLAVWRTIWSAWSQRHPNWRTRETLVLAQVPTITAVSRQALLAGLAPRAFADSLTHNRQEEARWRAFWRTRGLMGEAAAYASISPVEDRPLPSSLDSIHTRALALVHGATEGLAGVYAGLDVGLNPILAPDSSRWLEALIDELLTHDYLVTLTADHGHVEAFGIGQPQEGVTVITRSKRARIYGSELMARNVQVSFAQTTLWYNDGLLPDTTWVLMPHYNGAFAPTSQRAVSHGGITIDETIVPFIEIKQDQG